MTEFKKMRRPSGWMILGALLLVAVCLRALAGANRYGNASDQLRLELALSAFIAAMISVAAIMLVIYIGERPGRVRVQSVSQLSEPHQEVWAARVDSRSRAVLAAMSRADAGQLSKPGLYFVVTFDPSGMTIVTSIKKSSRAYFVPSGRIRKIRSLEYRLPFGRSNSISVAFERDGKRFDLPLVLAEWKFISHQPIGSYRIAEIVDRLQKLWALDRA